MHLKCAILRRTGAWHLPKGAGFNASQLTQWHAPLAPPATVTSSGGMPLGLRVVPELCQSGPAAGGGVTRYYYPPGRAVGNPERAGVPGTEAAAACSRNLGRCRGCQRADTAALREQASGLGRRRGTALREFRDDE
jgi:hypothetical protein